MIKKLVSDIYQANPVYLCYGEKRLVIEKRIQRDYQSILLPEDRYTGENQVHEWPDLSVVLISIGRRPSFNGVVHELSHAALCVFGHNGIHVDYEKHQEPFGYFIGWLADKVFSEFRAAKVQIRTGY